MAQAVTSVSDGHRNLHSERGALAGEHPGRSRDPIIRVEDIAWLEFDKPDLVRAEALEIGLADRVVPAAEVLATAQALVAPFVTGPTQALRAAKEAVDKGLEVSLDTGLEIEAQLFTGLFATNDQKTGMRSFVDNGPGKATFEGI